MKKFLIVGLFFLMVCCLLACSACSSCNESIPVSGIEFNESSLQLYVGDEYKLEYTISPEDATNINVLFYSLNDSVLTVSDTGDVYAVSQGSGSVIVMTEDGEYFDVCYITVVEREDETQNSGQADSGEDQSDDQTDQEQGEDKDAQEEDGTGEQSDSKGDEGQGEDNQDDNDGGEDDNDKDDMPTIVTYTVTFIADGEIVAVLEFTEDNLSVEEPEVPEKDGYTGKWEEYTLSLENITVNAVYTAIEYTATFIIGGYTYKIIFTIEDETIIEPDVPIKTGYKLEWESYSLKYEDFTVNGSFVLLDYTITYANTKGADNTNSDTYNVENYFTFEDLSLNGYIFEGWYDSEGKRVHSLLNLYGDVTFTAHWSYVKYELIFSDYTYESVATVYYTIDDSASDIVLPDVPEREGYIVTWGFIELTYDIYEPSICRAVYTKIT